MFARAYFGKTNVTRHTKCSIENKNKIKCSIPLETKGFPGRYSHAGDFPCGIIFIEKRVFNPIHPSEDTGMCDGGAAIENVWYICDIFFRKHIWIDGLKKRKKELLFNIRAIFNFLTGTRRCYV